MALRRLSLRLLLLGDKFQHTLQSVLHHDNARASHRRKTFRGVTLPAVSLIVPLARKDCIDASLLRLKTTNLEPTPTHQDSSSD